MKNSGSQEWCLIYKSSVLYITVLLVLSASAFPSAVIDWTAYNDCIGSTPANAHTTVFTNYRDYTGAASGELVNDATGSSDGMPTVTFTIPADPAIQPVSAADYGCNPQAGTDAYNIFSGKVDFSGTILQHSSSCGTECWFVEITFTNLNPTKKYTFVGSAFRNYEYTDRETRCTIAGADAYTNNSSNGVDYKIGNTTVFHAADNSNEGYVIRWDDIAPGADGSFSIVTVSADADDGRQGYPLHGFMLRQVDTANTSPDVDAGADKILTFPRQYLTLNGKISDDGKGESYGYLACTWSQTEGPAAVEFADVHAPQTAVRFPAVGIYRLQLHATDGLLTASDTVTISVEDSLCPVGDVDGDCKVTFADLEYVIPDWLDDSGTSLADLDGDTWVHMAELSLLGQSWLDNWTGSLQVTINPAEVRSLGAQWRVDEGVWQNSGAIVMDLMEGDHEIEDSVIAGWSAPGTQPVTITRQRTTQESAAYSRTPQDIVISEFMAINSYVPSVNSMNIYTRYPWNTGSTGNVYPNWIELHNTGSESINLAGWFLTDNSDQLTQWQFPSNMGSALIIEPGKYLVVFASGKKQATFPSNYPFVDGFGALHTNFSLSSAGEYLAVVCPDGMTISHEYNEYPEQFPFTSYGIAADGSVGYLTTPTPGTMVNSKWTGMHNIAVSLPGKVADTAYSHSRGIYESAFEASISCSTPGADIHYTLDGTEPQDTVGGFTLLYSGPITISATTCLRARAFKPGLLPSRINTQTYLFLEDVFNQNDPADYRYAKGSTAWGGYPADFAMENHPTDIKLVAGSTAYTEEQAKQVIKNALLAIPTLSIVADPAGIFGSTNGIYTNTLNSGELWERAVSAEYFNGDPQNTFQINCGLKIQGGASRDPYKEPKQSFSLRFRGGYGESDLKSDILKMQTNVNTFDSLQLRATYNNSWTHADNAQRSRATMIRDQFARDTIIAMGQTSGGAGTFVHLYINGLYWGVYNLHERPDNSHYASYFGGDGEYYDAYNGSTLIDGVSASWNSLKSLMQTITLPSQATRAKWDDICTRLDIDNVIDWTIVECWARNYDLKGGENWRAAGGGLFQAPWRFYLWDTEQTLTDNTVGDCSTSVFGLPFYAGYLANFDEFKIRFADRLYKYFYNRGALTYPAAWERYNARVTELQDAIIAESARWGDHRRDDRFEGSSLYTKNSFWLPAVSNVNVYLQGKAANAITFFRGRSLYPTIEPPLFVINAVAKSSGYVSLPCIFNMSNPNGVGTIYYTLDGTDPREYWTQSVSGTAVAFNGMTIPLTQSKTVKARVLNGTIWSALHEATYVDELIGNSLRITELMYHPSDPNMEFIELMNIGDSAVNLNLVRFTNGIKHTFNNTSISAGGCLLLVKNKPVFDAAYPDVPAGVPVIQWQEGALDNAGEKITFTDGLGCVIQSFEYKDDWYPMTDGAGFSLTVVDTYADVSLWNEKQNWRPGTVAGGSPGTYEVGLSPDSIVINEILAHSHDGDDWIELHNTTAQPISIAGWFLSDKSSHLALYQISENTEIPAGGYVVFYEGLHFGSAFALSENGETLYLTSGSGGQITGYQVEQPFDASERHVSMGRYVNSAGNMDFVGMNTPTPGAANDYPKVGPIVISEIQYNPMPANTGDEYIELYNISAQSVALESLVETEISPGVFTNEVMSWSFTNGIDYTFAPGTSIPAGGYLIIAKNPSAFNAYYTALPAGTQVVGTFANTTSLSNGGEKVRLSKPGEQPYGTDRSWIRIDQVNYDDEAPWPTAPDGQGHSLQRITQTGYGNDPANWTGAIPTPGT